MLVSINPDNPQPHQIRKMAQLLRDGRVICYPTDTVYGIGCDIFNKRAVERVFQIKRRAKDQPFSFMCSDLKDISQYAVVGNAAFRIMKKHLPGPYTFVLQGTRIVPKIMVTKQKTVGVRVPDNRICLDLLAAFGGPIVTTSATKIGEEPPLVEAYQVEERLGKLVDAVIDGGPVYPDPSSVISLIDDQVEVLREGKGDLTAFRL
ncbi:MAG: L-threonylcarbamoyladenylate synthase [Thermodesulfobacteriota bacterium]